MSAARYDVLFSGVVDEIEGRGLAHLIDIENIAFVHISVGTLLSIISILFVFMWKKWRMRFFKYLIRNFSEADFCREHLPGQ